MQLADALYVARHMRAVDRREIFALRWDDDPEALAMDTYRVPGAKYTCFDGQGPIAVGGLSFSHPMVATIFCYATDRFPTRVLEITRSVCKGLDAALAGGGLHRIECLSWTGHTEAHGWLDRLGFTIEAIHRRLGKGGEDYLRFVHNNSEETH